MSPVKAKYYRYENVKTKIIEKHVAQLLKDGSLIASGIAY